MSNVRTEMMAKVEELTPNVEFPKVETRKLFFQSENDFIDISEKKGLVGTFENGAEYFYGICSDNYQLIQHKEAIASVLQKLEEYPEYGTPKLKVRGFDHFARMMVYFNFPELKQKVAKVGDVVTPRIVLKASVDTKWKHEVRMGAVILACTNGMTSLAKDSISERFRHIGTNSILLQTGTLLKSFLEDFAEQNKVLEKWAAKKFNKLEFDNIWEELPVPKKHKKIILELPIIQRSDSLETIKESGKATLWDMNLAVTQYFTHVENESAASIAYSEEITKFFSNLL